MDETLRGEKFAEDFVQCVLDACAELSRRDVWSECLREDFTDFLRNLPTKFRLRFDAGGTDEICHK